MKCASCGGFSITLFTNTSVSQLFLLLLFSFLSHSAFIVLLLYYSSYCLHTHLFFNSSMWTSRSLFLHNRVARSQNIEEWSLMSLFISIIWFQNRRRKEEMRPINKNSSLKKKITKETRENNQKVSGKNGMILIFVL